MNHPELEVENVKIRLENHVASVSLDAWLP
ncbi:hypothetical protein BJB45_15945 [Halomonas huangheensis]|uniref:Uncharacterized protein n=1 Tax=Halomonas huangheensis TaxID=1178482 RepID=W1NC52_9GAMM|nr:hypothetical protein BJB45_15945 [Halomonas huangheensis]